MPVKILNLTSTRYGIGGVEKLLLIATDKYDTSRFSIAYCNLFCDQDGRGDFPTALRRRGVRYFHISGRAWNNLPGLTANLIQLLRRERFDVLHTHMLHATLVGQVAACIARVPIRIITRHYTDDFLSTKSPLIRMFDHVVTRSATQIVAVSDRVREDLIRQVGLPEQRVTVIYNGVDLSEFDSAVLEQPLPWRSAWQDSYVLGCVGNLFNYKGHRDLLQALARVMREQARVRLVVVGQGPERPDLEQLAGELGIADHVLFTGFRPDVAAILPHFDLYIQPSLYESFGIAILEAMAARKAVIGTNVGGIPEIIRHGETGLLVPRSDVAALAQAILSLVQNRELTRRMGECGRKRVEQHFSVRIGVDRYQELYNRLAEARSAVPALEGGA